MTGLVTFRLGAREYATALSSVREVVRLTGLADLPGMAAPLAGVLDLRGTALPVMDLRPGDRAARGDVLVMERADAQVAGRIGIVVDEVRAVVGDDALGPAAGGSADVLPAYVRGVLRGADGPVFLVDLTAMLQAVTHPPAQIA